MRPPLFAASETVPRVPSRLMRRCWGGSLVVALLAVPGCQGRVETPPDVVEAYGTLVGSLDPQAPGASFARLDAFAREHARYTVADTAEVELRVWRGRLDAAYLRARDLVRQEQFDEAEAILDDLARAPEEQAGRLSREFLAFDFAQMKATSLLQRGDTAAAAAVLTELTTRDLSAEEMTAAQRLLDSTSVVDRGAAMARTAAMHSAARALQVLLFESYVETGHYPAALTLDSPELASPGMGRPLTEVFASLDDYRSTADTFSLILTARDGSQRIRVTESTIEDVRAAGGR